MKSFKRLQESLRDIINGTSGGGSGIKGRIRQKLVANKAYGKCFPTSFSPNIDFQDFGESPKPPKRPIDISTAGFCSARDLLTKEANFKKCNNTDEIEIETFTSPAIKKVKQKPRNNKKAKIEEIIDSSMTTDNEKTRNQFQIFEDLEKDGDFDFA